MASEPTYFVDDAAVTAREAEVTAADFDNGCNLAGSNGAGIGINMNEGAVVGTPNQFTLLDQHGDAREAQISQHIGGSGLGDGSIGTLPDAVIRFGTLPTEAAKDSDPAIDGTIVPVGNATLSVLLDGWEIQA